MTVVFRADASDLIGSGHIMRCLTLANQLAGLGEKCVFACRAILPVLASHILDAGHGLVELAKSNSRNAADMPHAHWLSASWQTDADATLQVAEENRARWIVVDHYGLDAQWEKRLAANGRKLFVIDDLADRNHACDVLLDQNLHSDPYARYEHRVTSKTLMLFGQRFALLRPEFSETPKSPRVFHDDAITYCVAFSGADLAKLTGMTIDVLATVFKAGDRVHVIANSQNIDLADIKLRCKNPGWQVHVNANRLAEVMAGSDVAIGAGGGMLWERAAMGLPSIAIAIADNQREQVAQAGALGLVLAGDVETLTPDLLREMITGLRSDAALRQNMSKICKATVDGRGALRVARRVLASDIVIRLTNSDDSADIFAWRNDERIRRVSRNTDVIAWAVHEHWISATLANASRRLLIGSDAEGPVGVVRFDLSGTSAEISLYLVPQRLGSGQGVGLFLAADAWLSENCPEIVEIMATVLVGNDSSEDALKSCGYRFMNGVFVKKIGKRA